MSVGSLPSISVLIPTLNSERYLDECLRSIREQEYPSGLIEIIVADGGSADSTLAILRKHGVEHVVANPAQTGEAARAILNRLASRELVLSIDSDNYLVGRTWLRQMVQPLVDDQDVFAVEPLRWDYRRSDPALNRYFALSGVNDPVSLFMGNYGRYSAITLKWTEMPHGEERMDGYTMVQLRPGHVPTMGANGFLVRTEVLREVASGAFYFDIDAVNRLVDRGHTRVAKVDIALGHHFARDMSSLRRKINRRAEDYLYWRQERTYPWLTNGRAGIVRFVASTVLTLPLLYQSVRGWWNVRDLAWLYHVPVCWLTLWLYGRAVIRSALYRAPHSRRGWQH